MPAKVLIVDDCETTATPLEIALASLAGIEVVMLTSAFAALSILQDRHCHVAAVVTDLHLPQMNGFELIDNIRKNKRYAKIPVVVITGDSNAATRSLAFQKGASAYFPKPYSPADIRTELERLLHAS